MKNRNAISMILALILFFPAIYFSQVKGIEHVIIFGIDALSTDGISRARTPNLDYMMRNGAYSLHVRSVMPTVSAPNWTSILTGSGPEQHSVTSNDWEPADPPFPPVAKDENVFPSIFTVLKQQRHFSKTSAIYDWDKFQVLVAQKYLDLSRLTKDQSETLSLGINDLEKRRPDLSFLYFVFVDDAGHGFGHETDGYYAAVTKADSLLGVLLNYLKKSGLEKSTAVFVVSDHGGICRGHGGESLSEIEVPLFVYGAGVAKGREITGPVNNIDIAPTIAHIFGLEQPEAWVGKPVKSFFEDKTENRGQLNGTVKTPYMIPKGGLFYKESEPITIKSNTPEARIYYTVDGSEPTVNSNLYKAPLVLNSSCLLKAVAVDNSGLVSRIARESIRIIGPEDRTNRGVSFKYYEGTAWQQLPDFNALTALDSGRVFEISLDSVRHRQDQFAVKFEGSIKIEKEGDYKFTCNSDDGARIYIDEKMILNNDGSHSLSSKTGKTSLKAGIHKIMAEYYDDSEDNIITVYIEGPGIQKQILPAGMLFY